jgi:MEDS: MEthanogen/methylotroph, DcmR Sensory domain
MLNKPSTVDLGFSETRLPPGTHICQIHTDSEERDESLLRFLLAGVKAGERVACFSENVSKDVVDVFLEEHGVSLADALATQALSLSKTSDVYFQGGRFEPNVMLGLLAQFHRDATTAGCPGARVIGEMSDQINQVEGGSRLLEYESSM